MLGKFIQFYRNKRKSCKGISICPHYYETPKLVLVQPELYNKIT